MKHEVIWMRCLAIGIIHAFLPLAGCDKGEVEYVQQAEYVYVNKLPNTLRFELYESQSTASIEYLLHPNDSLTFLVSEFPLAFPFTETEASNRTGDSLVLRFQGNRCTSYKRDQLNGVLGGNGVFDLQLYTNYTNELINRRSYLLRYEINEKDYFLSTSCKN